ncbi:MAG: 3-deoxy-7-phosphoheptulonate synthase [Vulcanimicrobiota bacterium]
MVIIMKESATAEDIESVKQRIIELGCEPKVSEGDFCTILYSTGGNFQPHTRSSMLAMKSVQEVILVSEPYQLVKRENKKGLTIVDVNGVKIGDKKITMMAGPCTVGRRDELFLAAYAVKEAGADFLRGGTYKQKLDSDELPGLGKECLQLLKEAKQETGLSVITEVRNHKEVELIGEYADIIQISNLHMQNFELLAAAADYNKPVMLKRSMMASIKEWLMSAEYILKRGNPNVILCERGIRTFETYTEYTLDLSSVPVLKSITHLPVVVDPSHATGSRQFVPAMSKAAIAAGADGLLIEVHPNPPGARNCGYRFMELQSFKELMEDLKKVARAVGREL